ncbi:L,D-transpeptidase family protein [Pedobacter xixiisoli]|uniref:L,D-transpeptidase catalytic domain n=1 Tax=Pedobacter xixiisoli TaxID=1476464 RepID=A0A285ZSS3_9SPHI|nr:L,D-transpeptidase family protein [Pedobacter xixiisoli]SOD12704.1 L,D-transpeptidase catalytic domain [Pedobacter xixiisoli]
MNTHRTSINGLSIFIVALLIIIIGFSACKKSESEVGKLAFKVSGNKIFKEINDEAFAEKLKTVSKEKSMDFKNPKFLTAFYEKHNYAPVLLTKILKDNQLDSVVSVLNRVDAHGLSSKLFDGEQIKSTYEKIAHKNKISDLGEAYSVLVDLELSLANAITNYSNAMQFGVVSPRRIYAQYYTKTKRPDEKSFFEALEAIDPTKFLDSVQPKDKQYVALQKALKSQRTSTSAGGEEAERILIVNLERLRWQNKPSEDKYVWVNIPDFSLDVIEDEKSTLRMKVCVGEGRNQDYKDKLIEYDESGLKKDRPFNRETPQLSSLIHSVQVNPVWNIPESIANNEITKYAAADPYYLANNNIDVYLNGKKVEDPETVNWAVDGAGKKYKFKQRPGEDNSLGKIKFLFDNQSSVYLHDTPNQQAFNQQVRAVSHGCVRVEKPLELAQALFGNGATYEGIKKAMQTGEPKVNDIALKNKVPVYLSYLTCWQDDTGKLQYRKDVYGLDIVLYTHLIRLK